MIVMRTLFTEASSLHCTCEKWTSKIKSQNFAARVQNHDPPLLHFWQIHSCLRSKQLVSVYVWVCYSCCWRLISQEMNSCKWRRAEKKKGGTVGNVGHSSRGLRLPTMRLNNNHGLSLLWNRREIDECMLHLRLTVGILWVRVGGEVERRRRHPSFVFSSSFSWSDSELSANRRRSKAGGREGEGGGAGWLTADFQHRGQLSVSSSPALQPRSSKEMLQRDTRRGRPS